MKKMKKENKIKKKMCIKINKNHFQSNYVFSFISQSETRRLNFTVQHQHLHNMKLLRDYCK